MSRSNYDKPFYVDVGTLIAAVRCASNHDVLVRRNHVLCGQRVIKEVEELCDRLNKEAEEWRGKTANPPMGEPTAGTGALPPLDLPPGADGVEAGKKPWSVCSLVDLPGIGIEFSQFHTDKYFKFVCWWHNAEDKVGHVYEVTVKPWMTGQSPTWRALGQADGQTLFSLESSSKRLAIECGLSAMRRYLVRGHHAAWRTWRRALQSSILNPQSSIEKGAQA